MSTFLSLKMWLIFLHRLIKAMFPAEIVLLIFSWQSFKRLKDSVSMRFLTLFLICDLIARMVIFFAGVPFSGRYFYPLSVTIAIFAAAGITPFIGFLHRLMRNTQKVEESNSPKLYKFFNSNIIRKTARITEFQLYAFIILVIGISYSLKALHPRNDKPWLQMIPSKIKQLTPENSKPVIISNYMDERFGYYAGTTELYILKPDDNWNLLKRVKTENDSKWISFDNKRGIESFADKISKLNSNSIFIILRVGKDGNSPANTELIDKLPRLKLVKEFTDRKKRKLKLYMLLR